MNELLKETVEHAIVALSAKVISSCDDNRSEEARNFACALDDACRGLQHLIEAECDD